MQKDDKVIQNARKSKRGFFNLKGLMTLVVVATMMVGTAMPVLANNPNSQVTGPVQVLQVDTSLNVPIQTGDGYEYELVEEAPEPTPIPWQWVPISVSNEVVNGFNAIRRTYALPPYVNPAVIETESITMFGQEFNFAYLVQQNTANETFKEVRYTIEVDTASNNMTDILYRLESELRFDRDGFAGTLSLDIHSIRTVPAGQTRHTSTVTRQRTFPHLSAPDNAFIPRTIVDGGATFTLANVEWSTQGGGTAVDGQQMSSTFTATATGYVLNK